MTEYQIHTKNNPNMRKALAKARANARGGNVWGTWYWLDRAQSFGTVTIRQIKNLQKLFDEAEKRA